MSFLPGMFPAGAAAVKQAFKFEFTAVVSDTVNRASYTFNNVNIGAASSDRLVVVAALTADSSSHTINDITIGGVSGDLIVQQTGHIFPIRMAQRVISSGTTTTITIPSLPGAGNVRWCRIYVWTLKNYKSSTPHDTAGPSESSIQIDLLKGGIGLFALNDDGFTNQTWTGATPDSSTTIENENTSAAHYIPTVDELNHFVDSTDYLTLVGASWR